MKSIATALIAAAVAVPSIAFAAPKPAESVENAAASPVVASVKPRRYCVVSTPTGSRLERRECKTLDAWLAEGVDPRAQ
jgi:hypothetical protein